MTKRTKTLWLVTAVLFVVHLFWWGSMYYRADDAPLKGVEPPSDLEVNAILALFILAVTCALISLGSALYDSLKSKRAQTISY